MKTMKKMVAMLLVAVLVMAVLPAAFADGNTITVKGAVKDETYNAYQMLTLEVNDPTNPTAFTYKVASDWEAFFIGDNAPGAAYVNITNDVVTWKDGKDTAADMIALSQAAAAYAESLTATATQVAASAEVSFTGLPNGYYLITSTLGTLAMIDTTPQKTAVEVDEKNPVDTIEKTVKEDSTGVYGEKNDAEVGQLVEFKSVATIQPYTRNVFIHDTMDAGLDFTEGSIKIYVGEAVDENKLLSTDAYTILSPAKEGDTFTIQIKDSYIATLTAADHKLTLTYTAILTEAAVANSTITPQKNSTTITYGDKQSVQDETETTTHKFEVLKYISGDEDKAWLKDAEFQLQASNAANADAVPLVKIDDNNYRLATADDENTVTSFTTVENGNIVIWGVDSDTYYLQELNAPAGYNKLTTLVTVTVNAENTFVAEVENKAGNTLPTTGGMGTTLFYVLGSILVVGAGVILIAKKRMGAAE